jgi:hypothetical protein
MPFRYRRSVRLGQVWITIGKRGQSWTVGRTNFKRGYTLKTTIRLFRGCRGSLEASGSGEDTLH